jgi:hypothetical protein
MHPDLIEFDHELSRGYVSYNEKDGMWWRRQAANPAHAYAYRKIADFVRASLPKPPGVIVDYACGGGHLMARLHKRFPGSRLVGYDGSPLLLGMARERFGGGRNGTFARVSIVETHLPNFELPRAMADVVVFAFPNIVPTSADVVPSLNRLNPADLEIAHELAYRNDPDACRSREDPETVRKTLLSDRLVSLNMRSILKRGGICMRVEYGTVRREELSELELVRTEFEEGALGCEVSGKTPDQWFRVVASRYYRSSVIEDVYHQSRDESDRKGGYFITVLKAI